LKEEPVEFGGMSLTQFAEILASKEPTPGGGCASALAGALAAGLAAMVARTTAGSKKFADRAEQMNRIAAEADRLRGELLALVDEDARAFDQVMEGFRMPKETPEQQAARSQAIQQAYKAAVEPPMRVCTRSLRVLELAAQVAEQGNPSAASDAGVGALLAATALEGAALNVQINLASIKDEAFRSTQAEKVRAAETRGQALRGNVLKIVRAKLG
jgi:formiminotetrahydrofolate cyclodeaminase